MEKNNNLKKINLLAVSTAKNTNSILKEIIRQNKTNIDLKIHFGDVTSDFKASSLVRMNNKPGKNGHLFKTNKIYTGTYHKILASDHFSKDLETFIDQLYRHSDAYRYKSHNLKNLQDYLDYYHILADAISHEMLTKKINHVLFFNIPHLAYDTIIYQIAVSLEIPVTIVTQSLFSDKFFSLNKIEDYGNFNKKNKTKIDKLVRLPKLNLFYMKKIKQKNENPGHINFMTILQLLMFVIFKMPSSIVRPIYIFKILLRIQKIYKSFPKWRDPFANFFHENELSYFEHLAEFEKNKINFEEKFVYFPLPMQPEMTTSAIGGEFRDQLLALERLSNILPKGIKIYVKENPKQGSYARGPLFFHRISRIKSICFIPSYADTNLLTEKAIFIATVTGTVGWEALCRGKNILVFGHAWYKDFPGVIKYNDCLTYEEIIKKSSTEKSLLFKFQKLMAISHDGVIDRAYTNLVKNYDVEENINKTAKSISELILKKQEVTFSKT